MKLRYWENCLACLRGMTLSMSEEYKANIQSNIEVTGGNRIIRVSVFDSGGYLFKSYTVPVDASPDGCIAMEKTEENIKMLFSKIEKEVFA